MKNLFDTTGWVKAVTGFVASNDHEHDNVSFYGRPFANDKETIGKIRKQYAERTTNFYRMNHHGLVSNCASFAEYLRTGNVIDIRQVGNYMAYEGDLYQYRGQHINFGDTIAIFYFHNEVFELGICPPSFLVDTFVRRKSYAGGANVLRGYSTEMKRPLRAEIYGTNELRKLSVNFFHEGYHFLTCVGYEENSASGNIEPIFLNQNGRNILHRKDAQRILLPPFGNLEVKFIDSYLDEPKVPSLILCSKQ